MSRRARGVAGLSLVASAGLLGAYIGYPGLRKAHAATTCTVENTDDSGEGEPVPEGSLRECLTGFTGGTITFAEGLTGTITLESDLPPVTVESSVTITGNGAANTIIDGASTHRGFRFSGTHSVTVTGIAINNTDSSLDDNEYGGAIYSTGVDLVVQDSRFSGNEAGLYGGVIYTRLGDLTVTGSTFTSNSATEMAGAVFGLGAVTIADSTFTDNSASDDRGGAIYTSGDLAISSSTFDNNYAELGGAVAVYGDATISESTFSDNTASRGGAVFAGNFDDSAVVTVLDSTFTSNGPASTSGLSIGGGLFVYGSTMIDSSRFVSNSANTSAGAVYAASNFTANRSTFASNSATGFGGAVFAAGNAVLTQSTFSSNYGAPSAVFAMGTLNSVNSTFTSNDSDVPQPQSTLYSYSTMTLNFTTVSGNTLATAKSAASTKDGDISVTNSVFWNNSDGSDYLDVASGGQLSVSHSLFSSTSSVEPPVSGDSLIFGEDPLLGSLADNGGPTQTMMPAADSPVIGAANPVGAPATDQRGFSRTTNGLADMGAVQVAGEAPEPDLSQMPPSWHQAQGREQRESVCPPGMAPSWAQWPNEGTGGWTCEYTTWWDVNKGVDGGWVTTPGLRAGSMPGL